MVQPNAFGKSTALALAKHNVNLVLHYSSSRDEAEGVSSECRTMSVKSWTVQADLRNPEQAEGLLEKALKDAGPINEPGLVIPDPDIRKRSFIAIPLLELNPSLILPDTGEAISSLDIAKLWLEKSGFAKQRSTKADRDLEAVDIFTESLRERIKK